MYTTVNDQQKSSSFLMLFLTLQGSFFIWRTFEQIPTSKEMYKLWDNFVRFKDLTEGNLLGYDTVVSQVDRNILEKSAASIFRVDLQTMWKNESQI
jgi:hypothetical protein